MMFDRAFNKIFVMIPILVFLAISCSNVMNPHSAQLTTVPVSTPGQVTPSVRVVHDTVYRKLQTDDIEFRKRVEKLISDQNARFDSSEEHLKELVVLMSQQNLYISTRARMYKSKNDSLAVVLIRNQQETKQAVIDGFKKTHDAQTLNKSTYGMFETIGTICFTIVLLTYVIRGIQWIINLYNRKFKKLPVL